MAKKVCLMQKERVVLQTPPDHNRVCSRPSLNSDGPEDGPPKLSSSYRIGHYTTGYLRSGM